MRPLQKEIISALKVQPEIDPAIEVEKSVKLLKDYMLAHKGLTSYVLGISGGQDSTLAGRIAQLAIEGLREDTGDSSYQFIAVRLPYGVQVDEADAQAALGFIQPDRVMTVNIAEASDAMRSALEANGLEISDYNNGNIKARQRMIAQYAIAGQTAGAVIGTDHAAEAVTGFYTKFGDGAADIVPLWRLTKQQGREMLAYLKAPKGLYLKVPTADLEDNKPMQPDEVALGVSYEAIDAYLTGQDVSDNEAETIENWYLRSQHKRHLPITLFDDFWYK